MTDPTNSILERAAEFMEGHARHLERRLFDAAFRGAATEDAIGAVLAYRNPDGGFGHALEPDLRVASSQPIFVHYALSALRDAGATALPAAERTCAFLDSVADENGAVPYALPDAMEHARAGHWNGPFALAPSLHATTGILAGLYALGVEHEWLERAAAWCVAEIQGMPAYSGHTILNTLDLLQHLPDRPGRDALRERTNGRLFEADYVQLETGVAGYGLTPLQFAPSPDAPLRPLFPDDVIEAHLDQLATRQEADGGWPLSWSPPAGAATAEWRGKWTLAAALALRAYGRI